MKRSEIFFSVFQVPLDFFLLLAGFITAYALRDAGFVLTPQVPGDLGSVVRYGSLSEILPLKEYLRYVLYIIPVMIAIFGLTGLYAMRGSLPLAKKAIRVFLGVSVGLFFVLLLFLLRNDFFLPRSTVLYAWAFCTLYVLLGRMCIRGIQVLLKKVGIGVIRLGVVGSEEAVTTILLGLLHHPHSLYRLDSRLESLQVDKLIRQLNADKLDELIVVNEHYDTEDLIKIRNHCLEHQVTFSFVPSLFTKLQSNYTVRGEFGMPAIEVNPTPLDGWGRVIKRMFDIVASLVLIILFSPLYVFISLWMLLTSPGPLIYKNKRLGKDMEPILVWKFRSMKVEYCDGPGYSGATAFKKYLASNPEAAKEWEETSKLKEDPRVSTVGAFLRRTSLDELPQFFNVLGGSLSLVGPRPIVRNDFHDEVEKYGEAARILFTVKPGVTGLWQVSGRNDTTFAERIQLDMKYIENWTLWWDLAISLRTVSVFIPKRGKGAY
jgi:exopolysaccharide biosynthesis polyprenyl glycosylphosphotransferase